MTENQKILRGVSLGRKTLFFRRFCYKKLTVSTGDFTTRYDLMDNSLITKASALFSM